MAEAVARITRKISRTSRTRTTGSRIRTSRIIRIRISRIIRIRISRIIRMDRTGMVRISLSL